MSNLILVVDDNRLNRTILMTNLKASGYKVESATNGLQALEILNSQPIDAVLLDLLMPEMNGYELLAYMQNDSNLRHIPVIIISVMKDMKSVVQCIQMGATDYLPKPFDSVLLNARLKSSLVRKQLHDLELAHAQELSIQNEALAEQKQLFENLVLIARETTEGHSLETTMERVLQVATELIGAELGSIFYVDNGEFIDGRVWVWDRVRHVDSSTVDIVISEGVAGVVLKENEPILIEDTVGDERWKTISDRPLKIRSVLSLPIQYQQKIIAVLTLTHTQVGKFDQQNLDLMVAATYQIGLALYNAQIYNALRESEERSNELLLNILPAPIAKRLKNGEKKIIQNFSEATIIFADIVGFTAFAREHKPQDVLEALNTVISAFDQLADKHHLEKIKTIGDAYLAAGGIPVADLKHVERVADMALEMQEVIDYLNKTKLKVPFTLRVGISSGEVSAGVIGVRKFIYDIWGTTVNLANRMESACPVGQIMICPTTYEKLQDDYLCEEQDEINIKGIGLMRPYLLLSKTIS